MLVTLGWVLIEATIMSLMAQMSVAKVYPGVGDFIMIQ